MKFSVTIPAYKKKFLKEAIDSVINQSYRDFELIIVDDASPEDIKSVVSLFDDNRIRYYRNEKNCGAVDVVDNWNICLSYASGEYVMCMGDDDCLLPNCLEDYVKIIDKYPNLGVYHALTEIIDENGTSIKVLEQRPEFETALSLLHRRMCVGCRQFIGDFLFNASMLRNQGGFFKLPLAWASDDISAFRAAAYKGIANTQSLCFRYRENSSSITSMDNIDHVVQKLSAKVKEEDWYLSVLSKKLISCPDDEKKYNEIISKFKLYFRAERERFIYDSLINSMHNFFRLYTISDDIKVCRWKIIKMSLRVLKNKLIL